MIDEDSRSLAEYNDYLPSEAERDFQLHWEVLRDPRVLRAAGLLAAGLILLVSGSLSSGNSSRRPTLIGAALVVVAAANLLRRDRTGDRGSRIVLVAALLLGVSLLLRPNATAGALALALGVFVFIVGAAGAFDWFRSRSQAGADPWPLIKAVLLLVLGVAIVIIPRDLVSLTIIALGASWVAIGALTVGRSLASGIPDELSTVPGESLRWLQRREHSADERRSAYAQLFFEGSRAPRQLSRFFILMSFATVISTFGVIADSTAVVVGAMLIAPLMTPLVATSASIIMGWPRRTLRSLTVVAGGVALTIVLSFVLATWISFDVSVDANSQIVSRVTPTLLDLMIAIAAGGAGAFGVSRADVSDALPGVAVAIALVPPLTVVGITLEAGAWSSALGALLLFTTNAVAIILAGVGVFVLTGFTPLHRVMAHQEWIRNTVATVAVVAVAVAGLLGLSSDALRVQTTDLGIAQAAVEDWGGPVLEVFEVTLTGDEVEVVVVGAAEPPSATALAAELREQLGRGVILTVRWVPEQVFQVSSLDE